MAALRQAISLQPAHILPWVRLAMLVEPGELPEPPASWGLGSGPTPATVSQAVVTLLRSSEPPLPGEGNRGW